MLIDARIVKCRKVYYNAIHTVIHFYAFPTVVVSLHHVRGMLRNVGNNISAINLEGGTGTLRHALNQALQQNAELKSRLARIHREASLEPTFGVLPSSDTVCTVREQNQPTNKQIITNTFCASEHEQTNYNILKNLFHMHEISRACEKKAYYIKHLLMEWLYNTLKLRIG